MSTDEIRLLNDVFRIDPYAWGRLVVTAGVRALGAGFAAKAIMAVRLFDQFDANNDPHGEHDFGKLTVDGEEIFFKIDYYERGTGYKFGAEHPENSQTTDRVLTIMLAHEY